jgi:hypothetical protein
MYDYFDAKLRCPHCGTVSGPRARINMQTHIRGDADGSTLEVGYTFDEGDLRHEAIAGSGYLPIKTAAPHEPIRLLNVWHCPECRTEQWAEVNITNGKIELIEAVSLNRAVLEGAHFVAEVHAELLAASLLDLSSRDMREKKMNVVTVLRQHLR